jgi:PPOX class probable FMN-dependent enzyme
VPVAEPYQEIKDAAELRELLGPVMARSAAKDRVALHPLQQQWLAASPFCLIATSAADGTCDVSPKGDPAGFTLVLDERTIAIPERPGNRRGDGYHNVLENPHVGLIYLIPGRNDTLRINGRARLLRDAPFFDRMVVNGHRPKLALLVEIEQIFFHCAKAFMRSELWKAEAWKPDAVPPHAEISFALQGEGTTLEELTRYYGAAYAERLYKEAAPGTDPPAPGKPQVAK